MTVITDLKQHIVGPTSVALGCFDGLHLGHQEVIDRTVVDKAEGLVPSVFTFQENPLQVLTGKIVPSLLTPQMRKQLLADMGVEQIFMPAFRDMMHIEAEDFVRTVLKETCKAANVYCGFNYHFGTGGKADAQDLKRFGAKYGIKVTIVKAVASKNAIPVSSTQIRTYLQQGQVELATAMLGRYFAYQFPVVEGNKLGRKLGFPTINQPMPQIFVKPKRGVYASLVTLEQGDTLYGVTNIGVKPTVGDDYIVASETWLPNFSGNLYGTSPKVELVSYIREEQKFANLEALGEQIKKDKQTAFARLEKECPGLQ